MTQGVNDIVNAIMSGDSVAIDNAFNAEMAARISGKIEEKRSELASGLFTEKKKDCDESIGDIAQGAVNLVKKVAGVATGAVGGVTGALDGAVKGARKNYHSVADSVEHDEEAITEEDETTEEVVAEDAEEVEEGIADWVGDKLNKLGDKITGHTMAQAQKKGPEHVKRLQQGMALAALEKQK